MEDWQVNFEEVFYNLLDSGYSKKEAQDLVIQKMEADREYRKEEDPITLRLNYPLKGVEELDRVVVEGGWGSMPEEKKRSLLWDMGLDTKVYPWRLDIGLHRGVGGDIVFGAYLYGQERVDKGWVTKVVEGRRVASEEAQLRNRNDPSFERELRKLQGGVFN